MAAQWCVPVGLRIGGAIVDVRLAREQEVFGGVPAQQLRILNHMNLEIFDDRGLRPSLAASSDIDLIVDGVIGYSLSGAPRGPAAALIDWANAQTAPALALDTPSGLDAATGDVFEPTVNAAATLTLALPKQGLRLKSEQGWRTLPGGHQRSARIVRAVPRHKSRNPVCRKRYRQAACERGKRFFLTIQLCQSLLNEFYVGRDFNERRAVVCESLAQR